MSSEIAARFPLQARAITNARLNGRMAHAFLISGDQEASRLAFAQFLAQTVACTAPSKSGFCGSCRPCRMLAGGTYPELIELFPVGAMRQIKLGDFSKPEANTLRDFITRLNLTSFSGVKIGLIHDADRLIDAENALLKTLEEPPPNVVLILLSGNPLKLLPTTRSRCWQLALTENQTNYLYPGADTVFAALSALATAPDRGLELGMNTANTIIAVAKALNTAAAAEIDELWHERLAQAAELDPSYRKNMEARRDSEAIGRYLKHRELLLDSIFAFAAGLDMLAAGVPLSELPNPAMFASLPPSPQFNRESVDTFTAAGREIIQNLRFNIKEELVLIAGLLPIAIAPAAVHRRQEG